MNEELCEFCQKENFQPAEGFDRNTGYMTMTAMLDKIFAAHDQPSGSGIYLKCHRLFFDNSSDEYADGYIEIKYCPFCGKEIPLIPDAHMNVERKEPESGE